MSTGEGATAPRIPLTSTEDPRWQAQLTYTNRDDGVHLGYGDHDVNLGFWPTVEDVILELERLQQ